MPKDQDQQDIAAFCTGRRYTVTHCDGALDTFHQALGHVGAGKAKSLTRQMILQIKRLADGEPMSTLLLGVPTCAEHLVYQPLCVQELSGPGPAGHGKGRPQLAKN